MKIDEKIAKLKAAMPIIEGVTVCIVPDAWYKMHVDYDGCGSDTCEIVQIDYDYTLYAMPRYMRREAFEAMTVPQLVAELEI